MHGDVLQNCRSGEFPNICSKIRKLQALLKKDSDKDAFLRVLRNIWAQNIWKISVEEGLLQV